VTTSTDERWLREQVLTLAERNRQVGHADWCGQDYDFLCPSEGTYPFQWFWDSCFHAIAVAHVDPRQAAAEIRSLLVNQHEDGFVSHVTFWQRDRYESEIANYAIALRTPNLTDEMQPPVLAEAIAAVARAGGGPSFLDEVLPKALRFFDWCHRVRVAPFGDGLVRVFHPDETGLDHSPKFDELLGIGTEEHGDFTAAWYRVADHYDTFGRVPEQIIASDRFVVADVMVNTIYVHNLRVLADLLDGTDLAGRADELRTRAAVAARSLLERCWDDRDGLFFDLSGKDGRHLRTDTITALFPLLLPDIGPGIAQRLIDHVCDPEAYWPRFPIPSVSMREPSFRPDTVGGTLVWRGPTWINANWYVARGLKRWGRADLAQHIADRSVELIRTSGFREYYNPHTAAGHGAHDFGWSAIALDLLIEAYR
jgi:hypothetical protein